LSSSRNHPDNLRLPWEVRCVGEETYHTDYELKEKIHKLSFDDDNFLKPFNLSELSARDLELNMGQAPGGHKYYNAPGTFGFVLDVHHTQLAYRIMQVDHQLRTTRERLLNHISSTTMTAATCTSNYSSANSGSSMIQIGDAQETTFWKNYFYHCNETRISHLALYEDIRDETTLHMHSASTCNVGSSWLTASTGCPGMTLMMSPTADEEEEMEDINRFQPAFPQPIVQHQEAE
jgi:hypothetical protein